MANTALVCMGTDDVLYNVYSVSHGVTGAAIISSLKVPSAVQLCTLYCVQCTVYSLLYKVYCVACSVYSVLCTVYCVQFTV